MEEEVSTPFVVLKFGGTSVSSQKSWDTIAEVLRHRLEEDLKPILICSALSGVSNQLEALLVAAKNNEHQQLLGALIAKHQQLAEELGLNSEALLGEDLENLSRLLLGASLTAEVSPRLHARVLAHGELLSTKLGAAYLNSKGLSTSWKDAREALHCVEDIRLSDQRKFLSSNCNYDSNTALQTEYSQDPAQIIISQGFIASDCKDKTVLLGRGGSDTSAAYFAAKLQAVRCEIWTDVPGIFTSDPRLIPVARLIQSLDYEEAQEITSAGAGVLHPRCLGPLKKHDIPLHIRCTHHPKMDGTIISSDTPPSSEQLKAISSKKGVILIAMEAQDMWRKPGFLADAFACFKKYGLSIDLVSTAETNVSVTLDMSSEALDQATLEAVRRDLEEFCQVEIIGPCGCVSLVGRDIRSILGQIGSAFDVFEEKRIYLVSQAASDLNLSFVVDEDQSERLVRNLHSQLISDNYQARKFGPTWRQLFDKRKRTKVSRPTTWWTERREELISLAKNESPLYVYSNKRLGEMIGNIQSMGAIDKAFYAIKANNQPDILKTVYQSGLGFECVSPGEIDHVFSLFPDLDPKRIVFTPNFAPRKEYEQGLDKNVRVTLDNLFPLEAWPEIFQDRDVMVRLDPGHGRGHHKHVKTAGAKAKFGIYEEQIEHFANLAVQNKTRIVGLHAHTGSGIRTSDNWSDTALFLINMSEYFPDAKILDLGGGLGIPEKPGQKPLNLEAVDESLKKIKAAYPQFELWLEPGRYLVAEAGVLLAEVTQLKKKGTINYVGTNAGMNTLIRPALYGAYHEIVNLSRIEEPATWVANVVGPICESGDTFGYSRHLPPTQEGDILLLATAGAYGRTMSSEYNIRPPAKEIFLV